MNHLLFLKLLGEEDLAINPAKVLFYLYSNPASQQKDMIEPLSINRIVLSQCCRTLMHRRLLVQDGPYTSKKHTLTEKGTKVIERILNGTSAIS